MRLMDWLILVGFGVAWLAGWCSRWQWDKARDEVEEQPFARWPTDVELPSLAPIPENPAVVVSDYGKGKHLQSDRTFAAAWLTFGENMISREVENRIDRWARDLS